MDPYLDNQGNPHVVIIIQGKKSLTLNCFVDTGFSGGITLPEIHKNNFQIKSGLIQRYTLADGTIMPVQLYEFQISFKNIHKSIGGFFTKGKDALVGMEFLKGFKFTLDLKIFKISLE